MQSANTKKKKERKKKRKTTVNAEIKYSRCACHISMQETLK